MKDIRIFVASSKELVRERDALAFLVLSKEEAFAARGLRVRLAKWEYVDPRMTEARTEDRYLDEMYDCDAAFVLFRNIAGMYTREELDKALAAEKAGTVRLKVHEILFDAAGAPDSDAAKLRASLPEGAYGVWSGPDELRTRFLALVDRVAAMDGLRDAAEEPARTVSAFLAADDALAADRDAFADTVLNLNDVLARRGVRVRLRFYDPDRHRELLESSEMALVLYHRSCGDFGPEQMMDAYDRTRRDENPKRLYVFFRDADDAALDPAFADFKRGFAERLGHFFCAFENADTLKLNFLLSLENVLGDGASFVKLDGRTVTADGLEVGEITKLPMVANNAGLSAVLAELDSVAARFARQRERCNADPLNDALYEELMDLSERKNELQQQADKELSLSLSLAKRMSAISIAESNETIARARTCMEAGRIKEAIDILDGSSSSLRRRRLLRRAEERVDEEAQEIAEWKAGNEVEFFHAEAVMAYTEMPFRERFQKAESIYKLLVEYIEAYSERCSVAHKPEVDGMLADILCRFAALYRETGDALRQIPLLERALALLRAGSDDREARAGILDRLGSLYREQNRHSDAEAAFREALDIRRGLVAEHPGRFEEDVAESLAGLAALLAAVNRLDEAEKEYRESLGIRRRLAGIRGSGEAVADSRNRLAELLVTENRLDEAEREFAEALDIRRGLAAEYPGRFDEDVAESLTGLANLHWNANRLEEGEHECREALDIVRRLASDNPARFEWSVMRSLQTLALLHMGMNRHGEAEREFGEALVICRRLAGKNRDGFEETVAITLNHLAVLHRRMKRQNEAEDELREALGVWRRLAAEAPAKFEENVAGALNNLGNMYDDAKRFGEAEKAYAEALGIHRRLAAGNPGKFEGDVARDLYNLALLHDSTNRPADAEREYGEALEIYRRLADAQPAKFEPDMALSLNNLAILHWSADRLDEAVREFAEALEILRRRARQTPGAFDEALARQLSNLATMHRITNRRAEAEKEYEEALEILCRLERDHPGRYAGEVAEAEKALAACRGQPPEIGHDAETNRR